MAWDFGHDCFILDKEGNHVYVERNEAIKVWVYHTLRCERYRYRAYFDDYGVQLEPFVGRGPNDATYTNELYQTVKEGLLVNPYILNVAAVNAVREHKRVTLSLALTTVYGSMTMQVQL
ncbi:MAG: DUF2634 domain-containing protein [Veillonellaceae bacterium]|nr:DUF2634 domain-containing protein [Veillonellaceae bacterium]